MKFVYLYAEKLKLQYLYVQAPKLSPNVKHAVKGMINKVRHEIKNDDRIK